MTTLTAEAIVGGYPTSGRVLHEVSATVGSGEVHAVLGANGAGKTTFLRTLAGVLRPESGRVLLDEADITRLSVNQRVGRGLTLVPEGRQLFPDLSVRENLMLGGYSSRRQLPERLAEVHELFGVLERKRDIHAGSLSGGEQQMLAVGRGLMAGPKVLLLDEPCIGIAPVLRRGLYEAIATLAKDKGLAVIVSEQEVSLVMHFAHSVTVLQQGRVALQGPASVVSERENDLRIAYLGI